MKKAFLVVTFIFVGFLVFAQSVPYGNNPKAGKYLTVDHTKLYYEVYGSGSPLLLLHGDTYGYIDEFSAHIPVLQKYFKVIAVGMRGHGKSELGSTPYTYKLFAEDAMAILNQEADAPAAVLGFSAGAITAFYLAANYPEQIAKTVAMGGIIDSAGYQPLVIDELRNLTGQDCENRLPNLVASRKKLMPKPDSYDELIGYLRNSWLQPIYVDEPKVATIQMPVLIVGGDRDKYISLEALLEIHQLIPNSQLAIIPDCGHVGLILKPMVLSDIVLPFLVGGNEAN